MKAILRDSSLLKELRPLEIAAYLRSTGWTQQSNSEGKWSLWAKDDAYEILLPLQREYRDFALRMSEVLQLLEQVEERSQLSIFNDLLSFQEDRMPFIAEAGRLLRESSPREDFDLQGPVVKLERQDGQEKGRVTILGFVDEKPRKISMLLDEQDYQVAIDAHKKEQTVSCCGTLKKIGRGFELQAIRSLHADVD